MKPLLSLTSVSLKVDVWAVGCVMAELILGYNAFKDERCTLSITEPILNRIR